MPAVTRLGDLSTGHGCFGARPSTSASSDVLVNGIGAHRLNDTWAVHTCGLSSHDGKLAAGSSSVFVNGRPVGRVGDPINCGSAVATGSPNVFAGG